MNNSATKQVIYTDEEVKNNMCNKTKMQLTKGNTGSK